MQDYSVVDTIEKYDCIADAWTIMYFKLPRPLAKLGSVLIDDDNILIAGGMSKDFEPSSDTFILSLTTLEWTQK
jgi:N-acetylneuraminic acid mutarotase